MATVLRPAITRDELAAQAERLGAQVDTPGALAGRDRRDRLVGMVLTAYVAVAGVAVGVSFALGRNPVDCGGWLGMKGAAGLLSSLGAGICVCVATIAATRAIVRRADWAKALVLALRPTVHATGDGAVLALAVAGALAEELFFRGLLVPMLGILAASIAFGALHQIRGRARWWWMGWATLMGLLFGAIFGATGSLAGPIVAHAAINASNLRYLRDHAPSPRRRALGGLLQRS